ncbi:MAG: hypothetical protein PGN13_01255 [Patulibacter minatonensis]
MTDEIDAAGPWLWVNWLAYSLGYQARDDARLAGSALLHNVREEYTCFSDRHVVGTLKFGPYELVPVHGRSTFPGMAHPALVLRVDDHIPRDQQPMLSEASDDLDVERFVSGDLGDQAAWLLSLALGRRFRSWGRTRAALRRDAVGDPETPFAPQPVLEPDVGIPILPPHEADPNLADAKLLLTHFSELEAVNAVAVVRSARLYSDALWTSRADPAMAWLKLFGALESAAAAWDSTLHETPVEQLKARRPDLVRALGKLPNDADEAIEIVAKKTSRMMGAESKLQAFLSAHEPQPPQFRPPEVACLNYDDLEAPITVLYGHRSAELHGGIPFPPELCTAPHEIDGVPAEIFSMIAVGGAGGHWPASSLPMYLHTFAHITGEALRSWWSGLPSRSPTGGESVLDGAGSS